MKELILPISLLFTVGGCATAYDAKTASKFAGFSLAGRSDSTSTTLRNTYAWAFQDEACNPSKYGTRLGGELGNSANAASSIVQIAADEKFVFTAVYTEARFGQNRECAVTGSFNPIAGHQYKARLITSDAVSTCQLGVYDVTNDAEEQIEFSMPPYACIFNGTSTRHNGRPLWTDFKVRILNK
jgi:hypothetical protein